MEHRNTDDIIILNKSHLEIMSALLNLHVANSAYDKILNEVGDKVLNYNEAILTATLCEFIPKENIVVTEDFFLLIEGDLSDEDFYFHFNDGKLFLISILLEDKCMNFVFSNMYIDLFKNIQSKTYDEAIYVDEFNQYRDLYDFLPDYFNNYYEVTKRERPLE